MPFDPVSYKLAKAASALAGGGLYNKGVRQVNVALTDAATITPNLANGNMFTLLATSGVGNTRQIGLPSGVTAGETASIQIRYTQDGVGNRAVTFAAGITLTGAIDLNAGKVSIISLSTFDGGTSWQGAIVAGFA